VQAATLGAAIQQGIAGITLNTKINLTQIANIPADASSLRNVTLYDLLTMADILKNFPENYELFESVPQMLFQSFDHASFATQYSSRKPRKNIDYQFPTHTVANVDEASDELDSGYDWYYSSGLSNVLARQLRGYFKTDLEYWEFPFKYLLHKIGAHSFTCG
jgi:hypothetical protein